ncbi:MAG: response regulator transcription factor [Hyphomicrobiaceae bacterium]|nr:response regulator transcription factor [Hyphomicrobiaceae bacterium]
MKLLLVDDHAIVREGVRRLLADIPDAQIAEADNGTTALAMFKKDRPDVVLLDLNLDGIAGLELLRRMLIEDRTARVIVFSMHSEPVYAARALKLGARGYVSKSAASDELVAAVRKVADGGRYVERELASELAVGQFSGEDPLSELTTREVEILRMLGEGMSLTQIANANGVSYKTVANSCSLMKTKLGVERTADLIRMSIELFQK